MNRFDDWPTRLRHAVREGRTRAFSYGDHDCCTAAADCVLAITGVDLMTVFRGRYSSAEEAALLLKEEGKGTLLKTLISLVPEHGGKRIQTGFARKGDLVVTKEALFDAVKGQAAGIWLDNSAIFPGEIGWRHLPRASLVAAFQIG